MSVSSFQEGIVDTMKCVICGEVSALNVLQNGKTVCSCPSQKMFVRREVDAILEWIPDTDGTAKAV